MHGSHLHREVSGEPEVYVIMGQQHGLHPRKVLWLLVFHPQQLRGREAGDDGVPKRGGEAGGLRGGLDVTPQLCGADDAVLRVEGDEAVLLTADTNSGHKRAVHGLQRGGGGLLHGLRSMHSMRCSGIV